MTDRTVKVTLKGDISDFNRAMLAGSASAKAFTKELDTSNDRTTLLTQSLLAVGPALVPISAAAIPAVSGLTNQLAFAAAGAGVTALAFSGVGDALKATNDYAIEPSAANLERMQRSLNELGPAGRDFVAFLQELRPQLQGLQDAAQAGLFPGARLGIEDLLTRLPQVERVISQISLGIGDLLAEAGDNLADPRWDEFFTFLETEARPTLIDTGRSVGNLAEGFANLWMAFDPLSDDFSSSFLKMSRDFSQWTDGLSETQDFQEFIAYIQENGPRAWDALSGVGDALLQIVEAAAPVGSAALPVIEAVSDAIATVADTDLGPAIIGVISLTSAYSRLIAVSQTANSSALGNLFGKSSFGSAGRAAKDIAPATRAYLDYGAALGSAGEKTAGFATSSQRLGASLKGVGKLAGGAGGLAFIMSDLDDKMGLTNAAMGAMIGSTIPGWGTAIGAAAGLAIDLTHQTDGAAEAIKRFQQAFAGAQGLDDQSSIIAQVRQQIEGLREIASRDEGGLVGDKFAERADKLAKGLAPLVEQHRLDALAAEDAKFAEAGLSSAMALASDEARQETLALLENIQVKNQNADITERAFSAETNYRRALKDARAQANTNNAGIAGDSEAALKNRDVLDQLASGWNRLADAGGQTTAAMKQAQKNFLQVAEDMKVPKAEAKRLAEEMFHIPSPKPKVEMTGAEKAIRLAKDIKAALDAINPFKRISVVTHNSTVYDHGPTKAATGGEFNGPGGPRDDLIPAMVSNKEILVNAFDAQEHRDLILGINAGQFRGKKPRLLANGGEIQRFGTGGYADRSVPAAGFMLPPGAQFRLVGADLVELVDKRADLVYAGNDNYRESLGRRRR